MQLRAGVLIRDDGGPGRNIGEKEEAKKHLKQHSVEGVECQVNTANLLRTRQKPIHPPIIYHRINKDINPPLSKKHQNDAGYDLRSMEEIFIDPHQKVVIGTGIAFKIPDGYYGKIEARSGLAIAGLSTTGGVIDAEYQGEIKIIMWNTDRYLPKKIFKGDRIAQIIFLPIWQGELEEG